MKAAYTFSLVSIFALGAATPAMVGCEEESALEEVGDDIDEGLEEVDDEIDDATTD